MEGLKGGRVGLVYKSFSSGYARSDFQNGSEIHRVFLGFFAADPPVTHNITSSRTPLLENRTKTTKKGGRKITKSMGLRQQAKPQNY